MMFFWNLYLLNLEVASQFWGGYVDAFTGNNPWVSFDPRKYKF